MRVPALWLVTIGFLASSFPLRGQQAPTLSAPSTATASAGYGAELFFADPAFAGPALSPDGTRVCVRTRFDDRHYALTMIDLATKQRSTLARTANMTAVNFWWKSDDLMLLLVQDDDGYRVFQALDLQAGKVNPMRQLQKYGYVRIMSELSEEPDSMRFLARRSNSGSYEVINVNLRSGKITLIEGIPPGISEFATNAQGDILGIFGYWNRRYFHSWRPDTKTKWRDFEEPKDKLPKVRLIGVAPDQRRLLILDYADESATRVCALDPATGAMEEVSAARSVEPIGVELWGRNPVASALIYDAGRETRLFLNKDAEAADAWIAQALPGFDRRYTSFSRDGQKVLVLAQGSHTRGIYCVADLTTKKLSLIGAVEPRIDPARLGDCRPFSFANRDGQRMTGRITLPPGVARPPVVLLFGPTFGAALSNSDPVTQFLASNGYAVVRINHRGVSGFNRQFVLAGDFQIETGMVNDVADGLKWLESQNVVDMNRLVIFGQGSPGWVALKLASSGIGKVWVNWNTPVEPALRELSFFSVSGRYQDELVDAIGGTRAAAAYVRTLQPQERAQEVTIPSFHYYDRNGDAYPDSAARLEAAFRKHRPEYKLVVGPAASEVLQKRLCVWKFDVDAHQAMLAFLDAHLKPAK